jgi:stage II sporulation protein AA (anti-sigma F factor antagonist)
MALKITISEERDIVILELEGRIDSFSIDDLNDGFDRAMKTGQENILLILRDLEYINSRGIGALMSFFKWVKKVGRMVKIAEVPLNIMQVLNLLGLDGLTLIYDSASDAIESFRRRQFKEEVTEASETPIYGGMPEGRGVSRGHRTLYLFFGVVLVLLLAFFVVFVKTEQRISSDVDLGPFQTRLEALEGRLARLEAGIGPGSPREGRPEPLSKELSGRVEQIARALDKLTGEVASIDRRSTVAAAPEKTTTGEAVPRYHRVNQGESLYRIGRRYGISLTELCRLNRIRPNKFIYPGQKLIVGFSGNGGG